VTHEIEDQCYRWVGDGSCNHDNGTGGNAAGAELSSWLLIDVGPVQSVTTKSGDYGWGFMIKDSTRLRWITLTYRN
jgi:hypothetical protein